MTAPEIIPQCPIVLPSARSFASVADAARWYIEQGFTVVPVPYMEKNPTRKRWQELRLTVDDIAQYFNGRPQNIGANWGNPNGFVDVDLDCPEAIAIAQSLLPPTTMVFGRGSKPRSHYIYRMNPVPRRLEFRDPLNKQSMLLELRGLTKKGTMGFHSVLPGSTHTSGEPITFEPGHDSPPTETTSNDLIRKLHETAAASALTRYWPPTGRHNTMLALAGTLAYASWPRADALSFCRAVYEAVPTHDPNALSRVDAEVNDSFDKVATKEPATGFPELQRHIDPKVVRAAFTWLGIGAAGDERAYAPDDKWLAQLLRNEAGDTKALLQNAVLMLRHSPEWKDVLAYNEFSLQVETALPAPWPQSRPGIIWDEDADSRTACWLQAHGIMVNSKVAGEAVQVIARENVIHPLKREIEATEWDQQPRGMSWLHTCLGAEDTPLNAVMGNKYLIQSISRTYVPGNQADATLLLIGRQGLGKGTALRVLAGDQYFTDHLSDMNSKDACIELLGKRIIEINEFTNRRSELERKGYLTRVQDNFRPPYERRSRSVPRSCVFAATSNDTSPLTDETGGRRYWSVTCGKIDIEALRRDRDQLWAEALVQYRAGETWHVDFEEFGAALTEEQNRRYRGGAYDDLILPWLDNPQPRDYDIHVDHLFETEQGSRVLRFDSNPALAATHSRSAEPARVTVMDIWVHAIGRGAHEITDKAHAAIRACLTHEVWRFEKVRQVPGTRRTARFYVKESQ